MKIWREARYKDRPRWRNPDGTMWSSCFHCDKAINLDDMQEHVLKEHGYQKVGAQVFMRHQCIACNKPALYQVGAMFYCKEHKNLAIERRQQGTARIKEAISTARGRQDKEFWARQDSAYKWRKHQQHIHRPK